MGYSISDAVSEVLDELHPLRFAFKRGLVNQTALGRFIKPAVEKKMKGEDVGLDAIVMAIRRNEDVLARSAPETELHDILLNCKLVLRTGMVNVHLERSDDLFKRLVALEQKIDWASGEKMYVLQRTDELSVIAMSKYLPDLLDLVKGDEGKLLDKKENLALLTVTYPVEGLYAPGLLQFVCNEFYTLGINLLSVFSSYSKISFLFEEADAAAIYERLATAIKESREFANQKAK